MSLAAYASETNKQNLLMLEAIENSWGRGGGGVLPIMAFTGRLRPKVVIF